MHVWKGAYPMLEYLALPAIALTAALIPKKKLKDKEKIRRILENTNVSINKGDTKQHPKLIREYNNEFYTTYIYSLPFGLHSDTFIDQIPAISEGINKEVEHEFSDGVLKLHVYHESLPNKWTFTDDLLRPGTWEIPIGKNHRGTFFHDFDKYQTFLIGGVPGFGKTVLTKIMFNALILNNPQDVNIYVLDLKGGLEYSKYLGLPQVKGVASDVYEATEILIEIVEKMKVMESHFKQHGYTNIVDTDIKQRTFLFIDEGAELSPSMVSKDKQQYAKACQTMISEVARIGRAIGFRLIYSTQYPSSRSIDMSIKMNILAKVSFVVSNHVASQVILDESGAEQLPSIPGRCIYLIDKPRIIQVPYIDDKTIFNMMEDRKDEINRTNRTIIDDNRHITPSDNKTSSWHT